MKGRYCFEDDLEGTRGGRSWWVWVTVWEEESGGRKEGWTDGWMDGGERETAGKREGEIRGERKT